ncbi:MAG TPA: MFS transporter [Pseudonocardiaceae bacterium]
MTEPAGPGTSAVSLWRDRPTLGWVFASGVSQIGDEIWFVALAFSAAQLGSPGLAGLVLGCATIPRAALTLLGGALTDRFDARKLMMASDAARIVVLGGVLAVLAARGVSPTLLVVTGLLFGVADAFYGPADVAFPRQMVARTELSRLSALRQLLARLAVVVGAPIGGVIVAARGLSGAVTVDALSFAVILGVTLLVRPRRPRARSTGQSLMADVRDGLAYLRDTPRVRGLVIALAGLNVFVSPVVSVGLALRVSQQMWGAPSLGLFSGAIGAGAIAGTLAALRWRPVYPVRTGLLLLVLQAASLGVVGVAPYWLTVALMVEVGMVAGLASPMLSGAFQATVDEKYLGRTGAVLSILADGLSPVALAGFGGLAQLIGLGVAMACFGGAFVILLVVTLAQPGVRAVRADGRSDEDDAVPVPEN